MSTLEKTKEKGEKNYEKYPCNRWGSTHTHTHGAFVK